MLTSNTTGEMADTLLSPLPQPCRRSSMRRTKSFRLRQQWTRHSFLLDSKAHSTRCCTRKLCSAVVHQLPHVDRVSLAGHMSLVNDQIPTEIGTE